MALKTFNLDEKAYKEFSMHCKKHGISMSKRVEHFIRDELVKIREKMPVKKQMDKKEKALHSGLHSFSKYC